MFDPECVDEILIYHLIVSLFIILKVEHSLSGHSFQHYLYSCSQLSSYCALQRHLAPDMETLVWTPELFSRLEEECLCSALKFKTNFVSIPEVIDAIACTFSYKNLDEKDTAGQAALTKCTHEALFRSYLCL